MTNHTVTGINTVDAFQSIDEKDLATVGGGAGAADLIMGGATLLQVGIGLISNIASGVVGTLGSIAAGMADRLQGILGGVFGR